MAVIKHDEGISRLPGIDGIKKGGWYYGFKCSNCGEPIYVLDDPSAGAVSNPVIGKGRFSVPCRNCKTDSLIFGTGELRSIQAKIDILAEAPRRPKALNPSRQPLLPKFKNVTGTFGPNMLERRPACALIIARAMSTWSHVEINLAYLLSHILGIDTKQGLAVFLSVQSSRTQADMLSAAASAVLADKDLLLFSALLSIKSAMEKERNSLVHGTFGITVEIPNGVLWMEQKHQIKHTTTVWHSEFGDMGLQQHRRNTYVYLEGNLEAIASGFEWIHDKLNEFRGYLTIEDQVLKEKRYRDLTTDPKIAKEIRHSKKS